MPANPREIFAVLFDVIGVIQRSSATWRDTPMRLRNDAARGSDFLSELFAAERHCFTGSEDYRVRLGEAPTRLAQYGLWFA